MQDNLFGCSSGDDIDIDQDYDKDKYVVCTSYGDEIGYLPKTAEKWIDECDDNYAAFIDDIDEDDNEKYVVKVVIFKKEQDE